MEQSFEEAMLPAPRAEQWAGNDEKRGMKLQKQERRGKGFSPPPNIFISTHETDSGLLPPELYEN